MATRTRNQVSDLQAVPDDTVPPPPSPTPIPVPTIPPPLVGVLLVQRMSTKRGYEGVLFPRDQVVRVSDEYAAAHLETLLAWGWEKVE